VLSLLVRAGTPVGKPDPENLRYQAVSKQTDDSLHGLASASVAHGVGNKDVEKAQGGGTEDQSGFLGQPAPTVVLRPSSVFLTKQSRLIKDHLIFLNVISGPRQFTGQGTMGHLPLFCWVSDYRRPAHRVVSTGMFGCFREGQARIYPVAVIPLPLSLSLLIRWLATNDSKTRSYPLWESE